VGWEIPRGVNAMVGQKETRERATELERLLERIGDLVIKKERLHG
jgi:hypothetical protein